MKKSIYVTGLVLFLAGALIFLGYWALLLEKLQLRYIVLDKHPSWLGSLIMGGIAGAIIGTLIYVGNSMMKNKAFGTEHTKPSLKELLHTKAWIKWTIGWAVGIAFFTWLWAVSNF